jgi:hypothetical protein
MSYSVKIEVTPTPSDIVDITSTKIIPVILNSNNVILEISNINHLSLRLEKIDASSGETFQTVPTAVGKNNQEYIYKKIDGSENSIILLPTGSEKIEGGDSYYLTAQNEVVRLISDNENWWISGKL